MATAKCEPAEYNVSHGAVEWNMGEKFMLEDGVTYKVSFICWPSQEAYDIIAKLKNGTLDYDTDLTDVQRAQIHRDGDTYTLKTYEEGAKTTYHSASLVGNTVTVGDEQDPLPFQPVIPLNLAKNKINVVKTWAASKIDTQKPEPVKMQVWGGNEMYKGFMISPVETTDGSSTPNLGRSEDIYISCGLLKVNKSTGAVVVYESGHDFDLREVEENSRHWDLSASTCRPMVINNTRTMLILVEENDIPEAMKSNSSLAYLGNAAGEYYRIDGKVYKDAETWADLNGLNTRRSFLDLTKEVLVDDEVLTDPVDAKFTYKIKIDVDPVTLSWDPDLEKYIIISIRDANGAVSAASVLADQVNRTTAMLPSDCGFDESYNAQFLVAETGIEFYLSIKPGWSVRFLNLPAGTAYSIEEVLAADSVYEFSNARLETRTDSSMEEPEDTEKYSTRKIEGSISETSTLYKVVYQNERGEGSYVLTKVDAENSGKKLEDAVFTVYEYQKTADEPETFEYVATGWTYRSNEDGVITVKQGDYAFKPNTAYYLSETTPPAAYAINETKYPFWFYTEGSDTMAPEGFKDAALNLLAKSGAATVRDELVGVIIKKLWSPVPDGIDAITVNVMDKTGETVKTVSLKRVNGWEVTITDLPFEEGDEYTFEEQSVAGYELVSTVYKQSGRTGTYSNLTGPGVVTFTNVSNSEPGGDDPFNEKLPDATSSKVLEDLHDGTYKLTLSISIPNYKGRSKNKANVVVVYDSSNSMNRALGYKRIINHTTSQEVWDVIGGVPDGSNHGDLTWDVVYRGNYGYVLPSTGGPGNNLFYLFGSMLITLAGAGFILLGRKRELTNRTL